MQTALICFILGLGLSGLVRLVPAPSLANWCRPPSSSRATWQVQQVPTFPPVGAVNKIFYIALVAVLVAFVLDLLKTTKLDRVFAMVVPGLIVGWIGLPRFANGDLEAVTAGCAPWLGGSGIMATESGREIDCRTQRWEPGRHCNANGTHARFR